MTPVDITLILALALILVLLAVIVTQARRIRTQDTLIDIYAREQKAVASNLDYIRTAVREAHL